MLLQQIKQYLVQQQRATLMEVARHVGSDPDTVKPMLQHWVRKGYVSKVTPPKDCGTRCVKCSPGLVEVYQWN